jgi:hypothetical protein
MENDSTPTPPPVRTPPLIKLPNGDWIRADTITTLEAMDASSLSTCKPRLVVGHGKEGVAICYAPTFDEAKHWRETLATEIRLALLP